MTRLITTDISGIASNLKKYDAELTTRTGHTLSFIACSAVEVDYAQVRDLLRKIRVAMVPITSGEGIIGGFTDAVLSILLHMGTNAFVTQAPDVAGISEAFEKKADVLMLADDEHFVALHIHSRKIADNAVCTGRAFATGLSLMAGGLKGRGVLVLGCGPVGAGAAESLICAGAGVSVYDMREDSARNLAESISRKLGKKIEIVKTLDSGLSNHNLILDATPAGNIIHARHITPDTYVSAPGLPSGLDVNARIAIADRYLHDPLQLGVATMLVMAVKNHREHQAES